jgi:hypothetical protein
MRIAKIEIVAVRTVNITLSGDVFEVPAGNTVVLRNPTARFVDRALALASRGVVRLRYKLNSGNWVASIANSVPKSNWKKEGF